jgi:hypothetical protein
MPWTALASRSCLKLTGMSDGSGLVLAPCDDTSSQLFRIPTLPPALSIRVDWARDPSELLHAIVMHRRVCAACLLVRVDQGPARSSGLCVPDPWRRCHPLQHRHSHRIRRAELPARGQRLSAAASLRPDDAEPVDAVRASSHRDLHPRRQWQVLVGQRSGQHDWPFGVQGRLCDGLQFKRPVGWKVRCPHRTAAGPANLPGRMPKCLSRLRAEEYALPSACQGAPYLWSTLHRSAPPWSDTWPGAP